MAGEWEREPALVIVGEGNRAVHLGYLFSDSGTLIFNDTLVYPTNRDLVHFLS